MKTGRILVLLALVVGLTVGIWQAPAEAIMLGRVQQFKNIYYSSGNWYEVLPNGTNQLFNLPQGHFFIMTMSSVRFYANTPDTGPYRFYLLGPGNSFMYLLNLSNIYAGSALWGGAAGETLDPGIAFSIMPTPQVRQMPAPPANPNSGSPIEGTFYTFFRGYIFP
ncbi:MAG: hypothetical protein L6277_07285 [Desulfobacterales bacterium]|nr:hypothetical protein [Pseudomonadota bacterium]MBU4354158.1 hypothetical protein [Pseudomonadota bacterium]MCG2771872.1 hypothetical protein [Desulfobacterales bacterium]